MSENVVYEIPDVSRADEFYWKSSAVHRHYLVIRDAMKADDRYTIGNRQMRLLKAGREIPVTLQQCNNLLERYKDGS